MIIFLITITGSIWPDFTESFFKNIQNWLVAQASWIYILAVAGMGIFSFWLMFSRMGDIKLGPNHSEPDYTYSSWFAMLFSAGMGIGLLFFGVAEPIMHFASPPVGDPQTIASAKEAMNITFFHWGLHAWAIYALMAVILAYFSYRKNLPLLPRSIFYPFLGKKIYGPLGDLADMFCIIGTLFGVATSLGFGVTQVNAGLNYLFEIPQTSSIQVILIAGITTLATISVVLGLDGGIKRLSNLNMILAVLLLLTILVLGNTGELMKSFVENTGAYLSDITHKTFNLYAYDKKDSWIGGWTLLYWGWWVSWAPFVGMFIARISRGRTIREFMAGVLFVPTGFTFFWMTVFGNSAISIVLEKGGQELVKAVDDNVPVALFKFFEYFPFSSALSLLGLMLVITFFVSSSDSGSLVIDTLASGGAEEPPVWQRIYWAVLEGVVASVLLLAGGLEALQTMTIASAFPMIFLIIIAVFSFLKALREDYALLSTVQHHRVSVPLAQPASWKERLTTLFDCPGYEEVKKFMEKEVKPAFEELKDELVRKQFDVHLDYNIHDSIRIVVNQKGVEDFSYGIRLQQYAVPDYTPSDSKKYFRAEVFTRQGGQDYDVYGYNQEQIIADALRQYEKHLHYLHLVNSEQLEFQKKD